MQHMLCAHLPPAMQPPTLPSHPYLPLPCHIYTLTLSQAQSLSSSNLPDPRLDSPVRLGRLHQHLHSFNRPTSGSRLLQTERPSFRSFYLHTLVTLNKLGH